MTIIPTNGGQSFLHGFPLINTGINIRLYLFPFRWTMWTVVLWVALVTSVNGELASACNQSTCQPPDCRCSSSEVPGGFARDDTPQVILLTFDSSLTYEASETYREIIDSIDVNPNGCPVKVTFFVSHDFTNYSVVNEWYNQGHEIASNSITHRTDLDFWLNATKETWIKEMVDMRAMIENFANIPPSAVVGARAPFLLTGGNEMYGALHDGNITWDSSWSSNANPGTWPYTLDYPSSQDCPLGRCPTDPFPGTWVVPVYNLNDTSGNSCNLFDTCNGGNTNTSVFEFLNANFQRHYNGNRSPFGLYIHFGWLQLEANRQGLIRFLKQLVMYDSYLVTTSQLLEWVKKPTNSSDIPLFESWSCPSSRVQRRDCNRTQCIYQSTDTPIGMGNRVLTICNSNCPRYYPWYGNSNGTNPYNPPTTSADAISIDENQVKFKYT